MINNLKLFKDTWVRRDKKIDHDMVNDCLKHYKYFNLDRNSIVVDLGANIGGFATMCKAANVDTYIGYEPNKENFLVLAENIKYPGFWIVNSAVSAVSDKELAFYIRPSKSSPASSTLVPKKVNKGLTQVTVKNYHIDHVLDIKPNMLKMDIEGAEKQILEHWKGIIPDCINQFAIEIHDHQFITNYENTFHLQILQQGFELIAAEPSDGFDGKGKTWSHFGVTKNSNLFGYDLFYARNI